MTRCLSIIAALAVFASGCKSVVVMYDPTTGKYTKTRVNGMWGSFTYVVDREIAEELAGTPRGPRTKTWREYWLSRCAALYHAAPTQPEADRHINYILEKRRQAGLSDIPEIEQRKFPTRFELFQEEVNWAITQEKIGENPLTFPFDQTWPQYWRWRVDQAHGDSRLGAAALNYIHEQRRKAGLPEITLESEKPAKKPFRHVPIVIPPPVYK